MAQKSILLEHYVLPTVQWLLMLLPLRPVPDVLRPRPTLVRSLWARARVPHWSSDQDLRADSTCLATFDSKRGPKSGDWWYYNKQHQVFSIPNKAWFNIFDHRQLFEQWNENWATMLISAPGLLRPRPDGLIVLFPWETEVCTRDTQGDHLQFLYSRHRQKLSLAWVLKLSLNSFSFNFQKWSLWWWPSSSNSRRSRFVRLVLLSLVPAASC